MRNAPTRFWVFAYGSLIWRPGFAHDARVRARLDGYRRSFCMWSVNYRGTPEAPGLVLALNDEAGAACEGLAYEVSREAGEVLAYLRERELVTAAYKEAWLPVRLDDGREVEAVTYVIDRAHGQFCGELALEEQAAIIARSHGKAGANSDYLFETEAHLAALGCPDPALGDLVGKVRARMGEDGDADR